MGGLTGKATITFLSPSGKVGRKAVGIYRSGHGSGTLLEYEKDGRLKSTYHGQLVEAIKHGRGSIKYADGKVRSGIWKNDRLATVDPGQKE